MGLKGGCDSSPMLGTRETATKCVKTIDFSFQITINMTPMALTMASMKDYTVKMLVSWVDADSYFQADSPSVQCTNVNTCSVEMVDTIGLGLAFV